RERPRGGVSSRQGARLPGQGVHPSGPAGGGQPSVWAERARDRMGAQGGRGVRGAGRGGHRAQRRDDRSPGRRARPAGTGRERKEHLIVGIDAEAAPKVWRGRFYEDFEVGDVYRSRFGRTITETDNIWFTCLTMNTNPIHFSVPFAAG